MLKTKEERLTDLHPQETTEGLEALDQVLDEAGPDRAAYLLTRLLDRASHFGVSVPSQINTPYVNSNVRLKARALRSSTPSTPSPDGCQGT